MPPIHTKFIPIPIHINFDFKEEYKHYTPLELLRIVRSPDDYQQGAVDAATLLLDGFPKAEIAEAERLLTEEQTPVIKILVRT